MTRGKYQTSPVKLTVWLYICDLFLLILMYCFTFFVLSQIIAFDELKTDYKNPIDQCASLNPVSSRFFLMFILDSLHCFCCICTMVLGSVYYVHGHMATNVQINTLLNRLKNVN